MLLLVQCTKTGHGKQLNTHTNEIAKILRISVRLLLQQIKQIVCVLVEFLGLIYINTNPSHIPNPTDAHKNPLKFSLNM